MPEKFNPWDPFGLFRRRDGAPVGDASWSPPDPLHIFSQRSRNPDVVDGEYREITGAYEEVVTQGQELAKVFGNGATIGNPIPIEWAPEVIPLKNQAREQLIAKGWTVSQADKALHWAEEWMMGMARRLAPNNSQLQKTVVVSGYQDIAGRAEKWLRGVEAFAGPGAPAQ
jgi:hypothetical protein